MLDFILRSSRPLPLHKNQFHETSIIFLALLRLGLNITLMKTLCDWKPKHFTQRSEEFAELVSSPCFFCRKCGRVASKRKALCKAMSLPAPVSSIKKQRKRSASEAA